MITQISKTMKAIKKTHNTVGMTFQQDVPVPQIGPNDVLIAVTHAGICGTDRHIYEWDAWSSSRVALNTTIGHEFVGKTVKIGSAVTRVSLGQRVSAEGHIGCGTCQPCRTGNGHICNSVDILGIDTHGCFAQFVAVPQENVWPVHPSIPNEIAAIMDALGNAVHTVMAPGVSGKEILITGVGIIGLMAVTVAKAAGAGKIIVTDTDDKRLAIAKELGADLALNALDDQWTQQARAATGDQGPSVLLEMSGQPTAIKDGFNLLRNGGTVAMLGIPSKEVSFDLANQIIFKGATILGINGRKMFNTWYQMQNFLLSGRLNLKPIITHQIKMQDFDQGFKMMQSGQAIKVVMEIPQHQS